MRSDWYVLCTCQEGDAIRLRVVAGPLPLGGAEAEANHRARMAPEGFRLSVVEFDAQFGLGR